VGIALLGQQSLENVEMACCEAAKLIKQKNMGAASFKSIVESQWILA
jgi:hypothetical protein